MQEPIGKPNTSDVKDLFFISRMRSVRNLHCVVRPSDIQVALERIKYIEYEPSEPEPFYKPSESCSGICPVGGVATSYLLFTCRLFHIMSFC